MEYIEKCKKEFCPTCNFYDNCKAYKEDEMCDREYWEFLEQQLQEKDKELHQERQAKKELLECLIKLYKNLKSFGSNISKENAEQLIAKHTEKDKEIEG